MDKVIDNNQQDTMDKDNSTIISQLPNLKRKKINISNNSNSNSSSGIDNNANNGASKKYKVENQPIDITTTPTITATKINKPITTTIPDKDTTNTIPDKSIIPEDNIYIDITTTTITTTTNIPPTITTQDKSTINTAPDKTITPIATTNSQTTNTASNITADKSITVIATTIIPTDITTTITNTNTITNIPTTAVTTPSTANVPNTNTNITADKAITLIATAITPADITTTITTPPMNATTTTITTTASSANSNLEKNSSPLSKWGKLVTLDVTESPLSFDLVGDIIHVGRNRFLDVEIQERSNSASFAICKSNAGKTILEVLNRSIIYIDGREVDKTYNLKSGGRISFMKTGNKESISFVFLDFAYPYGDKDSNTMNELSKDYIIVKNLGKGATGDVVMGVNRINGNCAAIKMVNLNETNSNSKLEALKKEIWILNGMKHENIISIIKEYKMNSIACFSMGFGNCGTLSKYIKKGMEELHCKNIMIQIFNAVYYFHGSHLVHRDLKPDNICVSIDENNKLKVIVVDFAFSIYYKDGKRYYAGTSAYTSPELFKYVSLERGGDGVKELITYDPSSDVWSLGVILYQVLCGSHPFKDTSDIKSGKFNTNSREWKGLPNNAKDLVKKMLNVNPTTRITIENILRHPWLNGINL